MQAKQMSASLIEFALLLKEENCENAAAELDGLASVFNEAGTKTVAVVTKKIQQHWKSSQRPAVYPGMLKLRLAHAASVLDASKAPAPAKDYRALLALFVGSDIGVFSTFVVDMREALIAPVQRAKKSKTTISIDPLEIRAIADKLTALICDNSGFDAAVKELAAPRQHTIKELTAITEYFLGYPRKFKSKAKIIEAIRARQQQDAVQSSKDRRIKEIAV